VRFRWPAQRYDRLTKEAALVATALTTCAGFAIALPGVRVYRASDSTGAPSTEERIERIRFEQPRAVRISPARSSSVVRFTAPPAVPLAPRTRVDTSLLITTRVESSAHAEPPAKPMSSKSKSGAARAPSLLVLRCCHDRQD
jgi:hypothetical protein